MSESKPGDDKCAIGLVGLGLLGGAIAQRLMGAGWNVVGFDVQLSARERLQAAGGRVVSRFNELAKMDRVILCLPNSTIASEVGRQLIGDMAKGAVIVDTTTGDPVVTETLAREASQRSVRWVEANILGSSKQMLAGEAVVLTAGEKDTIDECGELLDVLGERRFYCGGNGAGQRMKLVANLVLGLNRAALAEGLYFAEAMGLRSEDALEVLQSGAAYSKAMDIKGSKMTAAEYSPQARLSQHLKDVRQILQTAASLEIELPLSEQHRELLTKAEDAGWGDSDNSAILEAYRG